MISDNERIAYRKACKEVLVILELIPEEEKNKISEDFLNFLSDTQDESYDFEINYEIGIEEQELLPETKKIIELIYINYWADTSEKEEIIEKLKENEKKIIEKKREEKLERKSNLENNENKENKEDFEVIQDSEDEVKKENDENINVPVQSKENVFSKFVKFIKNIFVKK
jgi:hypothetical protein